jgi:hypothetical protein
VSAYGNSWVTTGRSATTVRHVQRCRSAYGLRGAGDNALSRRSGAVVAGRSPRTGPKLMP